MAEPDAAPSPNVFDQIDPQGQHGSGNPFDAVGPTLGSPTSSTGAFGRGVLRSVIPAIGSMPAIGAGAEAGATVGAVAGPIGAGVGGVVGGFAGALLGSTALSHAQNWALSKLPDSWREAIGLDDRQERIDQGEHPVASFLGGLVPYAVTMRPGASTTRDLPENATALQRIMAHPATARVFGGAAMGGMELGQEAVQEGQPDWTKVAIATGFGLVFNKPTKFGEKLIDVGASPARRLLGRAESGSVSPDENRETLRPVSGAPSATDAPLVPSLPQRLYAGVEAFASTDGGAAVQGQLPELRKHLLEEGKPPAEVLRALWGPELADAPPGLREAVERALAVPPVPPTASPTVAQAADAKVAGPGITESVFLGTEAQDTSAALTAQDAARTERSATTEPQSPDLHAVARRMHPELFDRYEELTQQQAEFRKWIEDYNHPPAEDIAALDARRAELQAQLEQHVTARGGYAAGPEARRLRAQMRAVESDKADLLERAERFSRGEAEETADLALARKHLLATEFELRDVAPEVRAAYRRAADAVGAGTVEPAPHVVPEAAEAPPAPAPAPATVPAAPAEPAAASTATAAAAPAGKPLAEQKTFIAQDVTRQLIAAGRPAEEAEASGQIVAARYAARASRMNGALGNAEELYLREGAEVRGAGPSRGGDGGAPPAPAPTAPQVPTTREELAEFLRAGGNVEAAPRATVAPEPKPEPVAAAPEVRETAEQAEKSDEPAPMLRAPARKGPRARDPGTFSLLEFLSDNGGIKADDPLAADLRQSFGGTNPFIPGFGRLFRKNGVPLDRAREAAVEAGYLHDEGRLTQGVSTSTISDLLEAVDAESRGRKQYRPGVEPRARDVDPVEELHHMDGALDSALSEVGMRPDDVTGRTRDRVLEIMQREGVRDPIAAFERAVMEEDHHAVEHDRAPVGEPIPGWDIPDESAAASRPGEATAAGGQARAGEEARPGGERDREPQHPAVADELEYFQRKRERDLIREREAQGQLGLPGTERISDADLAQRKADEPLRPSVEQKPMEEGLFGTGKDQKELFQRIAGQFEESGALTHEQLDLFRREIEAAPEEQAAYEPPAGMAHVPRSAETFVPPIAEGYILDMLRSGAPDADINRALAFEREQRAARRSEGAAGWHKSFFQRDAAPPFYSMVQHTVDIAKQEKATPEQWLGILKNAPGVKREEMQWLGLEPWLREQQGTVTKQQIADYVRANSIEVHEVEKGGSRAVDVRAYHDISLEFWNGLSDREKLDLWSQADQGGRIMPEGGSTRYGSYQLPGGENYRELLLTLPMRLDHTSRPAYQTQHWPDESNVLAHMRFADRDIDGKRTLLVEEVQSDWHQKGRRRGYQDPEVLARLTREKNQTEQTYDAAERRLHDLIQQANPAYTKEAAYDLAKRAIKQKNPKTGDAVWTPEVRAARSEAVQALQEMIGAEEAYRNGSNSVPDAPFKTTWPELAMKRMIRYAAEHGYEQVAWVPGDVQADRYDLSKRISKVEYVKSGASGSTPWEHIEGATDGILKAWDTSGKSIINQYVSHKELPDYIGKDAAERILQQKPIQDTRAGQRAITRRLEGLELKVGGEGMRAFYDQILPATVNKLVKKFGTKVGQAEISTKPIYEVVDATDEGGNQVYSTHDTRGEAEAALDDHDGGVEVIERKGGVHNIHTVPITEDLRRTATEQGFPLFQGARGKVNIAPGQRPIITLFKDANASTFMHESGHVYLEEMLRDAEHPNAPDALKDDADTVLQWLGAHSGEDVKTRHHEKFARGFEQYLREGVAPSSELAGVFAKFKQWLVQIYQTIKGLGKPINDDIREVFDRMLAEEPDRTVVAPARERGPSLADIHETDATHAEPEEADAAMARVESEATRKEAEIPPEIANEIQAASERDTAARAEPAGADGERQGEQGEVAADRGGSGDQPAGGRVGPQSSEVVGSGGKTRDEGAGVRGPEHGRSPAEGRGTDTARAGERPADNANPLAPRATALFGKEESRFVDKAGNIRIENLTTSEDVARAIREAAEANDDFIGDRRGVVTDGQVMDLASDIGVPGAEKLVRDWVAGRAYNAEQVMALRKLLVDSATRVSEAMKEAAGTGSDESILAYAQARDRHQLIQRTVAGATAEAGRALRAFRDISEEVGDINTFLKSATGKTLFQLRREVMLGAQLDTPQQVSKFMHDSRTRSFGRMALEYWVNGLISGPATHTTYMIGNELLALVKAGPETAAAAVIGRLRQAGGREGDIVRFGEVPEALMAHARAIPAALQAAGSAFRSGATTLLPGESGSRMLPFQYGGTGLIKPAVLDEAATYHSVMAEAFGLTRGLKDAVLAGAALARAGGVEGAPLIGVRHSPFGAIPDIEVRGMNVLPVGNAVRLPGRFIAAIHSFFRTINYSMAKNAMAYRTAVNEGLEGNALASRIGDLRQDPTPEIMERAVHEATELTLMGQGGEFMKRLSALTNVTVKLPGVGETQILKFIDPFVHIAGNVINQAIVQRTPIGILSSEIRADLVGRNGTVAQDMAAARMLVGTGMAVVMGSLAAGGYASGSGPTDPHEAAMWRLAGNQAHSVRVGDVWYDIHRLGPLGMLLGIAADMYDVVHLAATDEYADAAAHFQHALTQNILDESFVRGPAELIRAVEDSDRYGPQYVRNFLSSFVPYSVGMAQVARASDPYSRQARSIVDAIKVKVPGLSESVLPRRDIWGEPMPSREALIAKGLTAIWAQQVSRDPVNVAMLQLGISPAQVTRKIRNVDLTDAQFDDFARIAGRMTKQRLDVIVRSPDYRVWPQHIQRLVIEETIKQSREAARGVLMMMHPQIIRDATDARLEKFRD